MNLLLRRKGAIFAFKNKYDFFNEQDGTNKNMMLIFSTPIQMTYVNLANISF